MLGAPRQDWDSIRDWSSQLAAFQPPRWRGIQETWSAIQEFLAYCRALIAERRRNPDTDLLSTLLEVDVDGDRLTQEELEAMFVLLFFAGHETTTNLISNGIPIVEIRPERISSWDNSTLGDWIAGSD
jgi:cytochrome P450